MQILMVTTSVKNGYHFVRSVYVAQKYVWNTVNICYVNQSEKLNTVGVLDALKVHPRNYVCIFLFNWA